MNILVWLVVGGLLGWAASTVMRTQEGILLNVVVGIVGAARGAKRTFSCNESNLSPQLAGASYVRSRTDIHSTRAHTVRLMGAGTPAPPSPVEN